MRGLGVVAVLAVACGGGQGQSHVRCVPIDEIPIVIKSDWDETEMPERIPAVLEAFARDSGHTCLPVTQIRVVDYVEPPKDSPPFVAGSYRAWNGRLLLHTAARESTIRHELCHALDAKEGITTKVAPDVWAPAQEETVKDYAEEQWSRELFARACESGPEDPRNVALRAQWGLQTTPRLAFLQEEVWVDAPVADVNFDLELDLTTEVLGEGDAYLLTLTDHGLDVVRTDGEQLSLARFDLDPLMWRAEIPLPSDMFIDGIWVDGDRTWVGGRGHWVQVDDQGITAQLDLPGSEEQYLVDRGVVLDGRVLTVEGSTGDTVLVDLADGTRTPSGLPWMPVRAMWRDGDEVVLVEDEGTWTGRPDRGWIFEPASDLERPIALPDGDLGEFWMPGVVGGPSDTLFLTDHDGVDHFPAEQIPGWISIWNVGGQWRFVGWQDQQLVLTTLDGASVPIE